MKWIIDTLVRTNPLKQKGGALHIEQWHIHQSMNESISIQNLCITVNDADYFLNICANIVFVFKDLFTHSHVNKKWKQYKYDHIILLTQTTTTLSF